MKARVPILLQAWWRARAQACANRNEKKIEQHSAHSVHTGGGAHQGGTSCWKRLRMLRTKALKSLVVLRASTRDCTSGTAGSHRTTALGPVA